MNQQDQNNSNYQQDYNATEQLQLNQNNQQRQQNQQLPQDEFKQQSELTCYESCLNCCGNCFGCLTAWLPCIFCCCPSPFVRVPTSFLGLLENFGKFNNVLQPGLQQINPWTMNVKLIDLKTRIIDLQRQKIITKDNVTVDIDTVVYFRVVDPKKAAYKVENLNRSVEEITYAALRTVCGEHQLQELLEKRNEIQEEIEKFVYKQVFQWGVFVENVFIKDMLLAQDLQNDMAAAAKQKRIGESKVISAKADVESAKLLREAADMLDSKAAMQIRYLETLQLIGKGQAPKVLFLPLHGSRKDQKK